MLFGALQLPYISGSVPSKSNIALPSLLSIVSYNFIKLPSSIKSVAVTEPTSGKHWLRLSFLNISLTLFSAFI
jgi:hypothetical protein